MQRLTSKIVTFIIVALCMPLAAVSVNEFSQYAGLRLIPVPVVGTGSMYPSLFWEKSEGGPDDPSRVTVEEYRTTPHMYRRFVGIELNGSTYLRREVGYGDMVAFGNSATATILEQEGKDPSSGFIKRIIGLPGDKIELRDGYVYKNGAVLDEPYIYKPRSTYGDSFLADCAPLIVPDNSYFVMGDNRKTSSDSRSDLGLVADEDISFVLPYSEQQIYRSLWRDTSQDTELSGTPTLDSKQFYALVNSERKSRNLVALEEVAALVRSAGIKGNRYLLGDQDYPLESSLKSAGYNNILSSEFVTPGHYTAEELVQNLLYFKETETQIMDSRYQDIGVTSVNKVINGCPTQVIVGHLGGYIPASYERETVESWQGLVTNLEQVIPSWEEARSYSSVDQPTLNSLLTILNRRLALAREITALMRDNKWLSSDQESRIRQDQQDADEADRLIKQLNQE